MRSAYRIPPMASAALLACAMNSAAIARENMDNSANATLLAHKAKSLVHHPVTTAQDIDGGAAARAGRGAAVAVAPGGASCGAVSLGNVVLAPGDIRTPNTFVYIQGSVINANNKC